MSGLTDKLRADWRELAMNVGVKGAQLQHCMDTLEAAGFLINDNEPQGVKLSTGDAQLMRFHLLNHLLMAPSFAAVGLLHIIDRPMFGGLVEGPMGVYMLCCLLLTQDGIEELARRYPDARDLNPVGLEMPGLMPVYELLTASLANRKPMVLTLGDEADPPDSSFGCIFGAAPGTMTMDEMTDTVAWLGGWFERAGRSGRPHP